jgi:hypothetical protein
MLSHHCHAGLRALLTVDCVLLCCVPVYSQYVECVSTVRRSVHTVESTAIQDPDLLRSRNSDLQFLVQG